MMEMMSGLEGGRVILPENRVLREPAAAIAPSRASAAIGAHAPRNTIWVDDDRDFYGEIRRVRALCWEEVRIVGGAFGDRCLMVKKIDRGHGLQQGALPPQLARDPMRGRS